MEKKTVKIEKLNKNSEDKKRTRKIVRHIDKQSMDTILNLFKMARETVKSDKMLADRYVEIARNIAMTKQIRLPSEIRRQFCTHCYAYLLPGYNCTVRVNNKCVIYHCPYCKRMGKIRIK